MRGFPILPFLVCAVFAVLPPTIVLAQEDNQPVTLSLQQGMHAYTTRIFVEPKMLAHLQPGDLVDIYKLWFTSWNYVHEDGHSDTYVFDLIIHDGVILDIDHKQINNIEAHFAEIIVRIEMPRDNLWKLLMPRGGAEKFYYTLGQQPHIARDIVITPSGAGLPSACDNCESISYEDYWERITESLVEAEPCNIRVMRGVDTQIIEIPCPSAE